ncbi:MAG TPA: phage holin family protein [Cytophagales bacterium]|nr:phage holin family protein [Cytophagales bacterium]
MLKVDNLVDNVAGYIENKIELVKLEAKETAARIIVKAILFSAIAIFSFFILIFASITAGLALNSALDSNYLGFLIVTGFYLLLLIVAFVLKNNEKISLKLEEFATDMFNNTKKDNHGKNSK